MAFSRLGRLLDVEWMLKRDEKRPSADVARHDRDLLRGKSPRDAEQALDLWLAARRSELDHRTLGIRVSEMLTALHVILIVLAGAAGAGAAKALLHGPSAHEPTNLLTFLFATLVWPLLLLIASAVSFVLRGRFGRSVVLEDLYLRLLAMLGPLTRSRAHDDWDLAHEWRTLRRSARRYRDIELGTLLSTAQWYPACFHLGAACTLLASALFSDLAFAWSTTQDSLEPEALASVFHVVSAPWCLTLNVGCVTSELVRATQFSRFTGQYALPGGAALSGAWWPALVSCLLVYGVVPRLVFALGLSAFVGRRAAHASERVLELRGRLLGGVDVISARMHPQLDGAEPAPNVSERPLPAARALQSCWVIRWRGATVDGGQTASLCAELGLRAVRQEDAGGSDFSRDDALLEASRESCDALVLVVEGWEAPDKATRRFVQGLRQSGASDRPIFIGVLLEDADAPELALWRDRLRLLEDPYVSVRALVGDEAPFAPEPGGRPMTALLHRGDAADASVPVFAVVGRVNRGKSSIIATLAEEDAIAISELPGTTRRSTSYDVALDGQILFRLIDTPGFEDAARALAWMQKGNPGADQRRARVAELRRTFVGSEEFVEECELLGPVLDGAAILYVVDGSTPFRENIMAEVEILRWTGQPRMALINRGADAAQLGVWHAALAPAFSTVRQFDAHAASFRERLQLLSLFRELVEPWRAPLGRAVERLTAEQARRLGESALAIASLLVEGVTHTIEVEAGLGGLSPADQKMAEQRFLDGLRALEQAERSHVEQLYRHHRLTMKAEPLERPEFARDLFSERVWSSLGLSASQLITAYSVAGAAAGGTVDAMVGGAAFFTGTVVGAAIGGAAALWQLGARAFNVTAVETISERLRKTADSTKRYRVGPHQHPNFPFVVLDRALLHHFAIRYRAHALNATTELHLASFASQTRELPMTTRQRLSKAFTRIRKSPHADHSRARQELTTMIELMLRDRERERDGA